MTLYSETYVIAALSDSGWPEMTESDAIEIWVAYGIRPSLCPIDLNEAMVRAKARMLRPAKQIPITENRIQENAA